MSFLMQSRLLFCLVLLCNQLGAQDIDIKLGKAELAIDVCLPKQKPKIDFDYRSQAFIQLKPASSPTCVSYDFLYHQAIKEKGAGFKKQEQTYLARMDYWLFPAINAKSDTIRVRVSHPPEWRYSVPWQPTEIEGTYQVPRINFTWPAMIAFGQLHQNQLTFGQHHFQLTFSSAISKPNQARLTPWLERALGSLRYRFAALSPQHTQVVVSPGKGNEPVPFGQVLRGGEGSLHFYINDRYSLAQFKDDWTAYHEVSHLLLPFISRSDAWVSEGFASYWQYLLMVDSGQIDPDEFWRRFYQGIRRGERSWERTRHLRLDEATQSMFSNGAVRRAYWSGAIVFFNLDFALRNRANSGPKSLEAVIVAFNQQARSKDGWHRPWSAYRLGQALDAASQSTWFSQAFQTTAAAKRFPNYQENFTKLGLYPEGKSLRFGTQPNPLRSAFTQARQ